MPLPSYRSPFGPQAQLQPPFPGDQQLDQPQLGDPMPHPAGPPPGVGTPSAPPAPVMPPAAPPGPPPGPQGFGGPPQQALYAQLAQRYGQPDHDLIDAQAKDRQAFLGDRMVNGVNAGVSASAGIAAPTPRTTPSYAGDILTRRKALTEQLGLEQGLQGMATGQHEQAIKDQQLNEDVDPQSTKSVMGRQMFQTVSAALRHAGVQVPPMPANATYHDLEPLIGPNVKLVDGLGQLNMDMAKMAMTNLTFGKDIAKGVNIGPGINFKGDPMVGVPEAVAAKLRNYGNEIPTMQQAADKLKQAYSEFSQVPSTDVWAKKEALERLNQSHNGLIQAAMLQDKFRMTEKGAELAKKAVPELEMRDYLGNNQGEVNHKFDRFVDDARLESYQVHAANGFEVTPSSVLYPRSMLATQPAGIAPAGTGGKGPGDHGAPKPSVAPPPGKPTAPPPAGFTYMHDGRKWDTVRTSRVAAAKAAGLTE